MFGRTELTDFANQSSAAAALYSGSLGSVSPDDVAISADGTLIYAAGTWSSPGAPVPVNDGDLRIYSAATGQLIDTLHLGTRLGAVDISPDGGSLLITELLPSSSTVATVYKVDVATLAVQTFNFTTIGSDAGAFTDAAFLSNGTALLTDSSGSVPEKILDLASGTFSNGPSYDAGAFLSRSADGSEVLIGTSGASNVTSAPLELYQTSHGIIADNQAAYYAGQVSGGNTGIQAFDENTGWVAQYVSGGLHIYGGTLDHELNLSSLYPQWNVAGLAFDATGQNLYILDDASKSIVEVSTLNWTVEQTINIGQEVGGTNHDGGFLLAPDGSYFTVATPTGLLMIDNPGVQPTIASTSGDDTLTGTSGTDIIYGQGGNDTIDGGAGADFLYGGDGNDVIAGGDGNDVIDGGAGNDQIDGGAGIDTASYADAASGVTVNLSITAAQDTGGAGTDALANIENLYGSAFDDVLIGDSGANILWGGPGDDVLVGGAGNDTLNGGAGFDTVDYSREAGTGNVYVNLGSGSFQVASGPTIGAHQAQDTYGNTDTLSSIEHVITGAGNDHVVGSAAAEVIETGAGDDWISGGGGGDTLIGGTGNDTYSGVTAADTIIEQPNGGFDTVYTSEASYTLPANVEALIGTLSSGTGWRMLGNRSPAMISTTSSSAGLAATSSTAASAMTSSSAAAVLTR